MSEREEKVTQTSELNEMRAIYGVKEAADQIVPTLRALIAYQDEIGLTPTHAYKIRVKSVDSLERKIRKRRDDGATHYSVASVTDIIGARFITLFRDELVTIASIVLQNISSGEAPFFRGSIEELIIYKSDRAASETAEKVREVAVEAFGEAKISSKVDGKDLFRVIEKDSGYSSIHIVARLDAAPRESQTLLHSQPGYKIPVEIQIRTVFEDAWGEIDHKYKYKVIESGSTGSRSRNYFVNKHIENLKGLADTCSQYANLIHLEASSPAEYVELRTKPDLADSDEAVLNIMNENKVDDQISKYVLSKRSEYVKAQQQKRQGKVDKALRALAKAADNLRLVREERVEHPVDVGNKAQLTAYYFLAMEEALFRYTTDTDDEVEKAIEIYKEVIGTVGENAVIYYRLGQAYDSLNDHAKAIESYDHVKRLINESQDATPNAPDDYSSWAIDTAENRLPISLSFTLGEMGVRAKDVSEKLAHFESSYRVSTGALDSSSAEIRHKLLNNSVNYTVEAIKSVSIEKIGWIDLEALAQLISDLEESCTSNSRIVGVAEWHTLMEGYQVLGDNENAEEIAVSLAEALLERKKLTSLNPMESDILAEASHIMVKKLTD